MSVVLHLWMGNELFSKPSSVWSQKAEFFHPALSGKCWACGQQCRADAGDPPRSLGQAAHSPRTQVHAWWIRLSRMPKSWLSSWRFSFETIATTAKQILELELKCISSNKHLSLFPDLSQKSFKRKRSIINWAFWRGPGTHLDNAPLSSTSAAPGKLFGLLLTTICEDDNLPKPLLVSPRLRAGSCSGGISLCSEQEHGDTL